MTQPDLSLVPSLIVTRELSPDTLVIPYEAHDREAVRKLLSTWPARPETEPHPPARPAQQDERHPSPPLTPEHTQPAYSNIAFTTPLRTTADARPLVRVRKRRHNKSGDYYEFPMPKIPEKLASVDRDTPTEIPPGQSDGSDPQPRFFCFGGCNGAWRARDTRERHWGRFPSCEIRHVQCVHYTSFAHEYNQTVKYRQRKMEKWERSRTSSSAPSGSSLPQILSSHENQIILPE